MKYFVRTSAPLALLALLLSSCKVVAPAAADPAQDQSSRKVKAIPTPSPAPTPTPVASPTSGSSSAISVNLNGATAIATSDFDVNTSVVGTDYMPAKGTETGAFRFVCGAGQLLYDDPIVYPGQPGKSHLHQFYGNLATNANSTYASQRAAGDSTCNSSGLEDGTGKAANRSGYWMPAMLDGKGNVIKPNYVNLYYKRQPRSDPRCNNPSNTADKAIGICVGIPNGIRFIFGYDMVSGTPQTGHHQFACYNSNAGKLLAGPFNTMAELAAAQNKCVVGGMVKTMISAPPCWDGKNLDSPNHRDHVAYWSYGNWGYLRCPADHPYVMPVFTLGAFFTLQAGDDLRTWHFSSDEMRPDLPAGSTFHADYFEAWDPTIKAEWQANCIDKELNCSGGNLGDLRKLKHASAPVYDGVPGWTNPHARVPIPPRPAG